MRNVLRSLIAVAVAFSAGSTAQGQEVRLHASQEWASHPLLGTPVGVGVGVNVPISARAGALVGLEFSGDEFRSTGSTCVGLIPPDMDCSPEPRDERARMWGLGLSVPVTLVRAQVFSVNMVPGVRTAWVRSDQEGVESGRVREASKMMYGYEIGAEAVVRVPTLRGALFLSGHVGQLRPYRDETLVDGYSPFESGIGYRRVRLGWMVRR